MEERIKELQELVLLQQQVIKQHDATLQVVQKNMVEIVESIQTMRNIMMEHLV